MQVIIGSPNSTACIDKTIYMFAVSGEMNEKWDYFVPKHNKAKAFSEIKRDIVLTLFENVMDSAVLPASAAMAVGVSLESAKQPTGEPCGQSTGQATGQPSGQPPCPPAGQLTGQHLDEDDDDLAEDSIRGMNQCRI